MCYCNCEYERFNPLTGDCHCRKGRNPCPEELEHCEECEVVVRSEQYEKSSSIVGKPLCEDCLVNALENVVFCDECNVIIDDVEEYEKSFGKVDRFLCAKCLEKQRLITCFHCGEKFEDEGYGKCPACRRKYDLEEE